jgi:two-component system sensor histidine kinase AgrC
LLLSILFSAFYLTISFFGIFIQHIHLKPIFLFYLYYILILIFLNPLFGQFTTIFVILGVCGIVWFSKHHIIYIILSLIGYFIGVLVNHLFTIPLGVLGFSIQDIENGHYLLFLLGCIFFTLLVNCLIGRFLITPRITLLENCPPRFLWAFLLELLLGACLSTFNIIYGEIVHYPIQVLTVNGILVSVLVLSSAVLFYILYQILLQNQQLVLQQQEQAITQEYMAQMEDLYQEMCTFRHDYKNILSTMGYYIEHKELEHLEEYFHQKILPTASSLPGQDFILGKLSQVQVAPIKSLLCSKLCICQNKQIPFTLSIPQPVTQFPMDILSLCQILGILLDNAIEAAIQTEQPYVEINLLLLEENIYIEIKNRTLPLTVPISELSRHGFSTKKGHTGLGLHTVQKLLAPLEHVQFSLEVQDDLFSAKLVLGKEIL